MKKLIVFLLCLLFVSYPAFALEYRVHDFDSYSFASLEQTGETNSTYNSTNATIDVEGFNYHTFVANTGRQWSGTAWNSSKEGESLASGTISVYFYDGNSWRDTGFDFNLTNGKNATRVYFPNGTMPTECGTSPNGCPGGVMVSSFMFVPDNLSRNATWKIKGYSWRY